MATVKATSEQAEWYKRLGAKLEHLDSAASLLAVNYDRLELLRTKQGYTPEQAFDDLEKHENDWGRTLKPQA